MFEWKIFKYIAVNVGYCLLAQGSSGRSYFPVAISQTILDI
jgi:hypothetical protein